MIAEIAHEEVLSGILLDILRIRLAGQEDRARITNWYLTRALEEREAFDDETSEIEARIQQYLDFNASMLAQIAEYQSTLQERLDALNASLAEQQAKIDALEQEARDIAVGDQDDDQSGGAP